MSLNAYAHNLDSHLNHTVTRKVCDAKDFGVNVDSNL
jgi:hypothetical protein